MNVSSQDADSAQYAQFYGHLKRPDFSEKTQTEVVWARHTMIWTGQDYPTWNSSRRETKRQTEETMGRQHQRVDWP